MLASEIHQEMPEFPYEIVLIVVCVGFTIVPIEKINLPNSKNTGLYSHWGEDRNSGTVVGGRLDQCSINRRCHGTIAFGH